MMPTNSRMTAALISMNEMTTSRVGWIRVRPVSTTNVSRAESSATATANGATNRQRDRPLGSANDGSNDATEVSALVIWVRGEWRPPAAGGWIHITMLPDYDNSAACVTHRTVQVAVLGPNCPSGKPECPDRESFCAGCCG